MDTQVTYHNKDVTHKVFADNFKEKSLRIYGLNIPKVKAVLPTNLPAIKANELRIDNLFLLEDGTIAIIDYESEYKNEDKIKYLNYMTRVLERYKAERNLDIKLRMVVIYTADVTPKKVAKHFSAGTLSFDIEAAFLSQINSKEVFDRLNQKVKKGEPLTDDELMEFIILPLTYKGIAKKKQSLQNMIDLAKEITDEKQSVFVLTGILVFSDKIIDNETAKKVKEWIAMTKVARLFEEEKEQALAEKDAIIAEKDEALAEKDAENARLRAELAKLKQAQ